MQDVVDALIAALLSPSSLDGGDACGFLDYADKALITGRAGAVGAGIDVGDIVADGAEAQTGLEAAHGIGQRLGISVGRAQNVESETLGALGADAGQLLQLFNEPGHGLGVA